MRTKSNELCISKIERVTPIFVCQQNEKSCYLKMIYSNIESKMTPSMISEGGSVASTESDIPKDVELS